MAFRSGDQRDFRRKMVRPTAGQHFFEVFMSLQTVRLKPNPSGKDRSRFGASAAQLGGEWADIKNVGQRPVDMTGIKLFHVAYSGSYDNGTWAQVINFTQGVLGVGQSVRVHSGSGPESALRAEDRAGVDFHVFTNRDVYTWNNDRGDRAAIGRTDRDLTDQASYDAYPPEGDVLQRVGNMLVPSHVAAGRR
jgi:hypothetical protein